MSTADQPWPRNSLLQWKDWANTVILFTHVVYSRLCDQRCGQTQSGLISFPCSSLSAQLPVSQPNRQDPTRQIPIWSEISQRQKVLEPQAPCVGDACGEALELRPTAPRKGFGTRHLDRPAAAPSENPYSLVQLCHDALWPTTLYVSVPPSSPGAPQPCSAWRPHWTWSALCPTRQFASHCHCLTDHALVDDTVAPKARHSQTLLHLGIVKVQSTPWHL